MPFFASVKIQSRKFPSLYNKIYVFCLNPAVFKSVDESWVKSDAPVITCFSFNHMATVKGIAIRKNCTAFFYMKVGTVYLINHFSVFD